MVSLTLLSAACSTDSDDSVDQAQGSATIVSDPPSEQPDATEPEPEPASEPTPALAGEPSDVAERTAQVEQPISGAEILGDFGQREVYLAPGGKYGFVQADTEQEDDRCLNPLLDAKTVCFEVSGARFGIQPRWDTAGERMAFASSENPDLMIANAADGTATVADPDEDVEVLDWTTQLNPGWVGSRLIAFRRDGSLTNVDERGLPGLAPGQLAPSEPPKSQLMSPPVSTQTGSVIVSLTDSELAAVSLAEWRSYPFPDSLERRSTRPGVSALRPPLVPIAITDQGQVVVADALPGAARRTGDWSATSGAYLLDLDAGEYEPIFVNGTEQATSVVAIGVSPRVDALIFLWADDADAENPIMRLSAASLDELPIDPRQSETLIEAAAGVVLASSDELNPLVWTAENQTAFRVDGDWIHVQLPEAAAPSVPRFSPPAESVDNLAEFLLDNPGSRETARCMAGSASSSIAGGDETVALGFFDATFDICEGDTSTRERASDLLRAALPDGVGNLYVSPPGAPRRVQECVYTTLRDVGSEEFIFAALRCDPDSVRTLFAREFQRLDLPDRYTACLVDELFALPAEAIDDALRAADDDELQASANVVDLISGACAPDLIDPDTPGPTIETVVDAIEAATGADAWLKDGPVQQGGFDLILMEHGEEPLRIAFAISPATSRVVSIEIRSASPLGDELLELIGPEFGVPREVVSQLSAQSGYVVTGDAFKLCWSDDGAIRQYLFVAEVFGDC